MDTPIKPPSVSKAKIVEQRAEIITDPVAKLRYLRKQAAPVPPTFFERVFAKHKPKLKVGLGVAALGAAIFAIATSQRPVKARTLPPAATRIAQPLDIGYTRLPAFGVFTSRSCGPNGSLSVGRARGAWIPRSVG